MTRSTSHEELRSATRDQHARLDALFATFDLAKADDYAIFLRAHAAPVLAFEAALDAVDFTAQLPDWPLRRRGTAILDDLAALAAEPIHRLPLTALADVGAAWGTAYVLEGSRLGGAVLARQLAEGLPRVYLAGSRSNWPDFLKRLDAALDTPERLQSAIAAAIEAFDLFEQSGRRVTAASA